MEESADHLVVIIFSAKWVGSVEILRGFMETITSEQPSVEVQWVNIEEEKNLTSILGVVDVPSLVMLRNKEVVDYIGGVIPRRKIALRMQGFI